MRRNEAIVKAAELTERSGRNKVWDMFTVRRCNGGDEYVIDREDNHGHVDCDVLKTDKRR